MRCPVGRRRVTVLDTASCAPNAPAALPTPWRVSQHGVGDESASAGSATRRRGSGRGGVSPQRFGCFGDAVAGFPTWHCAFATLRLIRRRRGGFPDAAPGKTTRCRVGRRGVVVLDRASWTRGAPAALATPRLVSRRGVGEDNTLSGFAIRRRGVGHGVGGWRRSGWFGEAVAGFPARRRERRHAAGFCDAASRF
jgi:hypothetical protein